MAKKTISKSLSAILQNGSIISDNIKLNAETIGRYGMNVPSFTTDLDMNLKKATELNIQQERLKSEQKIITLELNKVLATIEQDYALAKKTVKLAEPQAKWVGYGIADKK